MHNKSRSPDPTKQCNILASHGIAHNSTKDKATKIRTKLGVWPWELIEAENNPTSWTANLLEKLLTYTNEALAPNNESASIGLVAEPDLQLIRSDISTSLMNEINYRMRSGTKGISKSPHLQTADIQNARMRNSTTRKNEDVDDTEMDLDESIAGDTAVRPSQPQPQPTRINLRKLRDLDASSSSQSKSQENSTLSPHLVVSTLGRQPTPQRRAVPTQIGQSRGKHLDTLLDAQKGMDDEISETAAAHHMAAAEGTRVRVRKEKRPAPAEFDGLGPQDEDNDLEESLETNFGEEIGTPSQLYSLRRFTSQPPPPKLPCRIGPNITMRGSSFGPVSRSRRTSSIEGANANELARLSEVLGQHPEVVRVFHIGSPFPT